MPGPGSVAYPKPLPRTIARRQKQTDREKALLEAYAVVDRRDQGICKATGAFTIPHAIDARQRREHHHIHARGARPDLINEPSNIVTLRADVPSARAVGLDHH